jgi:pyruvate dehydrogenase E2 component (dihydrolipoamide acetyltransferase)
MKFTPEAYNQLVEDVEKELSALLAKSESEISQPLVKSEEESKEEEKDESPKEESKEEPKEEAKADEKQEDKEEEKKDADQDEKCDYDDADHEEMHKMYESMSKAELKAHKDAVDQKWMAKCGDMQQMAKSEETTVKVETKQEDIQETELVKSENTSLKKENEDLKKNVETLVVAMNSYLSKKAPERKAVTDMSFIAKSEEIKTEAKPLSKSEVTRILSQKAQGQLSKSDREAINNFYINNAAIETVSHLLK